MGSGVVVSCERVRKRESKAGGLQTNVARFLVLSHFSFLEGKKLIIGLIQLTWNGVEMVYSAYAVANAFIQRALEGKLQGLTPMKLQKLMYFAQAWHIKKRNRPLLDDHFSRWMFGPVIPAIYHEFKVYGQYEIKQKANTLALSGEEYRIGVPGIPPENEDAWALIDAIVRVYGGFDGPTLSNMTHAAGSAWSKKDADGSVITFEEILNDETIA